MAERHRIKKVFNDSLEVEITRRPEFVFDACGADISLRNEVISLLESYDRGEGFLEVPAFGLSAEQIGSEILEPEEATIVGKVVGAYRIEKEIGRGGMGSVYLATRHDRAFTKQVAVKLLRRGTENEPLVRRFEKERQIIAGLEHPNIARLIDGGTTENNIPFFVMEYVSGLSVDKYCDDRNLSTGDRLTLFREICSAVEYAHSHSVIHRDIKPSNILINEIGGPKLLDFGIAKTYGDTANTETTATAFRVMTPEYASPEQMRGDHIGIASDIYSLGVLLYQLLTGKRPYNLEKKSQAQIVKAICEEEPMSPSFVNRELESPESVHFASNLDRIILKALRKEPRRRYASVKEFSEDIGRLLEGKPISARDETIFYRLRKFFVRNRTAVLSVATASAVFLILGHLGYLNRWADVKTSVATVTKETRQVKLTERSKGGTENAEARALYIRGQEEWNKRTAPGIRLSVELYEKAIEQDPEFSLAFSGISNSYFLLSVWGAVPANEAFRRARAASLKSIELAPEAAEGHLSLAVVYWLYDWDWPSADHEFKKAIELDPSYALAPHWYGLFLGEMGRSDESIASEKHALEMEPTSIPVNADLARVLYYARRYDEALDQYRKVLEMKPGFEAFYGELTELYEATGMTNELIELSEQQFGENLRLRKAIQEEGMHGYWRVAIEPPNRPNPQRPDLSGNFLRMSGNLYRLAELYAQLGQPDKAFESLDNAFAARMHQMAQVKVNPRFDVLRSDPRFAALLKRLRFD